MEKILLDTDIGSDIDDAICLAYLLKQKECELMGITTVSGEADKRAMMASAICNVAGRGDIPIFAGAEAPLLTPQLQPVAKQSKVLDKWEHQTSFPKGEAVEFMRQTIRKNPNEITLLGIGPMTNIALLFSIDPEIPSLLKEMVLMCGIFAYKTPAYVCLSEWNARCDPYASHIMYKAPVKKIKSIGLDVTTQVTMVKEEAVSKFKADVLQPLLDFSNVWDDLSGIITFHDPLAGVTIFNNDICGFETGNVEVEIGSKKLGGLTSWEPAPNGKNEVAFDVNSELFFKHYFDVVN